MSEQVVDELSDFSSAKGPKRAMLSVCVRAFTKNDDETPPSEIPAAVRLRDQYFEARRKGALVIEELPRSSGGQR